MAGSQLFKYIPLALMGLGGAWAATRVRPEVGFTSAFIVLFGVSWLLFRFSSGEQIWQTLGWLKSPPIAGMIGFLAVFIYFSFEGVNLGNNLVLSLGGALIAAATGMWLFKYWTIGN